MMTTLPTDNEMEACRKAGFPVIARGVMRLHLCLWLSHCPPHASDMTNMRKKLAAVGFSLVEFGYSARHAGLSRHALTEYEGYFLLVDRM